MEYDVAIVGAGPAGSACAALCAAAGMRTLVIEKSKFPREKVCGDCLNPGCWPLLERLEVRERVLALKHAWLEAVEFIGTDNCVLRYPLPGGTRGEIAVKRSAFDQVLLERAVELGAHVRCGQPLTALQRGWRLRSGGDEFAAKKLVAADGRNSTVARFLGILPASRRDRVGLQTHLPAPRGFGHKVAMRLRPEGYCGAASVGEDQINLCLVSRPRQIAALKAWAAAHFQIGSEQRWRTLTPLSRKAAPAADEDLFLVGDAARVVEPFTGEGIYYALASGALAADHLIRGEFASYAAAHRELYRGRLWINQLAKAAVLHPRVASRGLSLARHWPHLLRFLTAKVLGHEALLTGAAAD